MTPDYFTSKWFMTIFACFLPYAVIAPIFDMFLLEGWRAVFRIGIALLRILQTEISTMDMTLANPPVGWTSFFLGFFTFLKIS